MKSRFTAKEYQIWYDPAWNQMRSSEWNTCGCCPGDLIETWGHGFNQAGWYGRMSRKELTGRRLKSGWTLLDESTPGKETK